MYCKECGRLINNENAVICVKCGTSVGEGSNFCNSCGVNITNKNADVCVKCGVRIKNKMNFSNGNGKKSKIVAIVLTLCVGIFGAHRFYLGYMGIGITQLILGIVGVITGLTYAIVVVWAIVDLVMIITGKLKNYNGVPLS